MPSPLNISIYEKNISITDLTRSHSQFGVFFKDIGHLSCYYPVICGKQEHLCN